MVLKSPVWLLGLPPVMEVEHDGEGAGGQHLLVVIVVQAVSRCQSKSVPNLSEPVKTTEFHRNNDFEIKHFMHEEKLDEKFDGVLTITALHLLFI